MIHKIKKSRLMATLLTIAMVVALTPVTAFAADPLALVSDVKAADGGLLAEITSMDITNYLPHPDLDTTAPPAGTAGLAYTHTFTASDDGKEPYTFSHYSGTLPTGLTMSETGILSGIPTIAGDFTFSIMVKDADLAFDIREFKIEVNAPATDVCDIVETGIAYTSLDEALTAVQSGETIRLLKNIENGGIVIENKSVTFDLNGRELTVKNEEQPSESEYGAGLYVKGNATVGLSGEGEFNAIGTNYGVLAECGENETDAVTVRVTNATGYDYAGVASYGAKVTVKGNAKVGYKEGTGGYGVTATGENAVVTVDGNISAVGTGIFGAGADSGATIDVKGYVTADGIRATGIEALYCEKITVEGDVTVSGHDSVGIVASEGSEVTVNGNIRSDVTGVRIPSREEASGALSNITVDGVIVAQEYINIGDTVFTVPDGQLDSETKAGYRIYSDGSLGAVFVAEFAGGSGSPEDPYLVAHADQLYSVRNHLDKHFLQTANIDLGGYSTGKGWNPIGREENPFTGAFNGGGDEDGYTISDLLINTSDLIPVGLFGVVGKGAEIRNFRLEGVDVTSSSFVGGLAGFSAGSITDSYVTGTVAGSLDDVGGLVGYNSGKITGSYASGTVMGRNGVGGLAGVNGSDNSGGYGEITSSYSTCAVQGTKNVGGLLGWNGQKVNNSFAAGNITGETNVGGLAGYNDLNIVKCYARGAVEGVTDAGGLVGNAYGFGTAAYSYWDTQSTGISISAGGEGKTTAQMKLKATYNNWDFNTVWDINGSNNNGYPFLRGQGSEPEQTYALIITAGTGGSIITGSSGNYAAGTVISIAAAPSSGYSFNKWSSSGGGTFGSTTSAATNFTMPAGAVIITAGFTYNGSGGGGGSGGGSSSDDDYSGPSIITPPATAEQPNPPVTAEFKVRAKVDGSGKTTVSVPDKAVIDAIKAAQDSAKKNGTEKNGIAVSVNIGADKTASSLSVTLSQNAVSELIKAGVRELRITGSTITIAFDLTSLKQFKQAGGNITIQAAGADISKLSAAARTAIGSRPVFDLSVKCGGKIVSSFGSGLASVTISHTIGADEKAGNLFGVYVDESGRVIWLPDSAYDQNAGRLRFSTGHFSIFGVGYKADVPVFTDIAGHWAEEDIEFVSVQGLFYGTGNNQFSPNTSMTRGMFVTVLGRLGGIDAATYKNSKFADVSQTAYYAPYVAWTAEKGIVSGTGATSFAPDQKISRQEMAVIMSNYAKAMGYTVPETCEAVTFADNGSIAGWAKDAVKSMQMAGILMGKDGNRFDPADSATRAEVAALLHRYVNLVID